MSRWVETRLRACSTNVRCCRCSTVNLNLSPSRMSALPPKADIGNWVAKCPLRWAALIVLAPGWAHERHLNADILGIRNSGCFPLVQLSVDRAYFRVQVWSSRHRHCIAALGICIGIPHDAQRSGGIANSLWQAHDVSQTCLNLERPS